MKLSTFAIIVSILAFGFGFAFIFVPAQLLALYGITIDTGGVILARYLGGANIFLGLIFWSYSKVAPTAKSWPKLLLFSLIYDVLQLIFTLIPLLGGQSNSMGWSTVALFTVLAIGSAYFMVQCNKAKV